MKIAKDTVVTLQYKVADLQGKLLEQSTEPLPYLHGGYDNTLPKIEAALDGHETGHQVTRKEVRRKAEGPGAIRGLLRREPR